MEKLHIFSSVKIKKTGEAGVVADVFEQDGKKMYIVEIERMHQSSYHRIRHSYSEKELEQIHEFFPKP